MWGFWRKSSNTLPLSRFSLAKGMENARAKQCWMWRSTWNYVMLSPYLMTSFAREREREKMWREVLYEHEKLSSSPRERERENCSERARNFLSFSLCCAAVCVHTWAWRHKVVVTLWHIVLLHQERNVLTPHTFDSRLRRSHQHMRTIFPTTTTRAREEKRAERSVRESAVKEEERIQQQNKFTIFHKHSWKRPMSVLIRTLRQKHWKIEI